MEKDIAKKLHEGIQEHLRYQEANGDKFNVFDAMNVRTSELAWSAMIAYLLKPKGKHCCGDAFLKLFLKHLPKPFEFNTASASVSTEWDIKELGRIDIIVTDENEHQAIIIENKIFASDQHEQIARYYRYATEKMCYHDFRLLYLTRFGSKPSDESTCGIEDFYCISYIDTIKRWLEECSRKCLDKKRVHDFICQAIDAINELCRQTIIDDYTRHLIEESLNLSGMMIRDRVKQIQSFSQSEYYTDVAEQCTKLIKQYRKEQFDELITHYFHQSANVQPLEGVLDGYWCCRASIDGLDEIDNVYVMHDWEGRSLYCGVEFKNTSGHVYNELMNQAEPYVDDKNGKKLIWQIQGLDDFDELYGQLEYVLKIVTRKQ